MKQRAYWYFALTMAIALVMAGCGQSIRVPVTKAAEINLRGINKIAIGEIKGNGGQEISDLLTSKLFETNKFEIVDRTNLDRIMKEHNLNLSGAVDEKTAVQLGKFVGSSILVFGNVSLYKTEQKNTVGQPWQDKEGGYHQSHFKKVTAKVNVSFQVVGLTTGKILAAKTINKTAERSTNADNGWPEDPDRDAALDEARNAVIGTFVKMISPWTDYVNVKFAFGGSNTPEMKQGIEFAKAGRWNDAVEQFKLATQSEDIKRIEAAHAGAWWNLGLAYEYSYMFKEAEEAFNTSNKIKPHEDNIKEIANVKRLAAERKKLEEQGALESEGNK